MTTTESRPVEGGQTADETRPSASVIVPAFNEASVIRESLAALVEYMTGLDERYEWEIVVVDDGSDDGTAGIAEEFAATHPNVRVLRHPINLMLGQALRTAFNACTSDYLVVIDCDLSYSPDHVGRLLDTIVETGARIVIASPYMEGGRCTDVPFVRLLASRVANRILSLAASGRLRTLTGMVRAYDRRFVSAMNLKAMGVEVNTEIIYKAQLLRARIVEIPAHLDWRAVRATPRRSTVRLAKGTAYSLLSAFIFRPFMFFIVPGLLLALAGVGLFVAEWATAGDGRELHLAAEIFLALAVLMCSIGIMALQAKRYFEELFHLGTSILRELREQGRDGPLRR